MKKNVVWTHLLGGGGLLTHGLLRRRNLGYTTAAIGGALLAYGVKRALQKDTAERPSKTITIQKTITVAESPGEAYAFWRKPEKLSELLSHVRSIEQTDEGRWRWTVAGPLGFPIRWDVDIVKDEPGRLYEWQSPADSAIQSSGLIRFKKKRNGKGTKIHAEFTYTPTGGWKDNAAVKAFAAETEMPESEELVRV